MAFAIGGQPLGLDLLDHPATMRRLFEKLVRSYALDALDAPKEKTEPASREAVLELLARVTAAESFTQPAVGLGKDVRLNGGSISGAALWAEQRYVHLCVRGQRESGRNGAANPDEPAGVPQAVARRCRASIATGAAVSGPAGR